MANTQGCIRKSIQLDIHRPFSGYTCMRLLLYAFAANGDSGKPIDKHLAVLSTLTIRRARISRAAIALNALRI